MILAGVGAGLVLAEIALRLLGVDYSHHAVPDYYTGWSERPGVTSIYSGEGHSHIRINSQGLRDREHSFKKPPNTLRVAVLGDSFTEAAQVEAEQAFWSVMERELARGGVVRSAAAGSRQ